MSTSATYSDSQVESATILCRADFQDTTLPLTMDTILVVERRSGLDAQLASLYPEILTSDPVKALGTKQVWHSGIVEMPRQALYMRLPTIDRSSCSGTAGVGHGWQSDMPKRSRTFAAYAACDSVIAPFGAGSPGLGVGGDTSGVEKYLLVSVACGPGAEIRCERSVPAGAWSRGVGVTGVVNCPGLDEFGRRGLGRCGVHHAVKDEHGGIHRLGPPAFGHSGVGEHRQGHLHDGSVDSFGDSVLPLVVWSGLLVLNPEGASAVGAEDAGLIARLGLRPGQEFEEVFSLRGAVGRVVEPHYFVAGGGVYIHGPLVCETQHSPGLKVRLLVLGAGVFAIFDFTQHSHGCSKAKSLGGGPNPSRPQRRTASIGRRWFFLWGVDPWIRPLIGWRIRTSAQGCTP
ncbi:hypothetical protein AaE_013534 [Aphanomyces astaci]|uniref:Uncharacterized protein n=1 Tax=Aphanomyces astaci TaxID=112090 RepID=A0A6A4ZHN8_APHAT|nr:hypothetical protein AaE_013534 [Aphanomyces astaci]